MLVASQMSPHQSACAAAEQRSMPSKVLEASAHKVPLARHAVWELLLQWLEHTRLEHTQLLAHLALQDLGESTLIVPARIGGLGGRGRQQDALVEPDRFTRRLHALGLWTLGRHAGESVPVTLRSSGRARGRCSGLRVSGGGGHFGGGRRAGSCCQSGRRRRRQVGEMGCARHWHTHSRLEHRRTAVHVRAQRIELGRGRIWCWRGGHRRLRTRSLRGRWDQLPEPVLGEGMQARGSCGRWGSCSRGGRVGGGGGWASNGIDMNFKVELRIRRHLGGHASRAICERRRHDQPRSFALKPRARSPPGRHSDPSRADRQPLKRPQRAQTSAYVVRRANAKPGPIRALPRSSHPPLSSCALRPGDRRD